MMVMHGYQNLYMVVEIIANHIYCIDGSEIMKRIVIISIIVIVLAAIVYGCSCFFVPYKADIDIGDINYYQNLSEYAYDTDKEMIAEPLSLSATAHENFIYYIDPETRYLYRVDNDFKNTEIVLNDKIEEFLIKNDELYYTTKEHLYKMNILNNETVEIGGVYPRQVNITDKYIYFLNKNEVLFRADLEGNNIERISGDVDYYIIKADKIFFTRFYSKTLEDYVVIHAMNDDGTNQHVLVDINTNGELYIQDNNVYFGRIDKKIYRLNLLAGSLTQVNRYEFDYWTSRFQLADDHIYYGIYSNDFNDQMLARDNINGEETKFYDNNGRFTPLAADENYIVYRKDYKETITMLYLIADDKAVQLDTGGGFYEAVLLDNVVCVYSNWAYSDQDQIDYERSLMFFSYDGKLLYSVK